MSIDIRLGFGGVLGQSNESMLSGCLLVIGIQFVRLQHQSTWPFEHLNELTRLIGEGSGGGFTDEFVKIPVGHEPCRIGVDPSVLINNFVVRIIEGWPSHKIVVSECPKHHD